jgi:hypothetical protein
MASRVTAFETKPAICDIVRMGRNAKKAVPDFVCFTFVPPGVEGVKATAGA